MINYRHVFNNSRTIVWILTVAVLISILANSIPVYRACSFILFLGCLLLGKNEPAPGNPYLFFSLTPLSLACYYSLTEVYLPVLKESTWLLCIINIYAFILALSFTRPFWKNTNCIGIVDKVSLRKHALIMFLLSLLGAVIPPLSSILWLFSVSAVVCAIKTKDKLMYGLVLLYMGMSILSGLSSKMGILLDILTFLLCYLYYFDWKKQKKRLVALCIFGFILMFLSFTVISVKGRGVDSDEANLNHYQQRGGIDMDYIGSFFMPYMYFVTAWGNVNYVIESQNTRTYGLWMAKPILGYIGLDDLYEKKYDLDAYSGFNTFSFVSVHFKDFGIWLSVIPSLFLGFFVKKIYSRSVVSKSPLDISTYVVTSLAVVEMFFSNHFFMLSYPFTMFIIMEIYKRVIVLMKDDKLEYDYKNLMAK